MNLLLVIMSHVWIFTCRDFFSGIDSFCKKFCIPVYLFYYYYNVIYNWSTAEVLKRLAISYAYHFLQNKFYVTLENAILYFDTS